MVRNVDSPSKFPLYLWFLQVMLNAQVDDLSSHITKYTSPALTSKFFANMRRIGKGFSGVETPLFDIMLVQPQADAKNKDDKEVPDAPTPVTTLKSPTFEIDANIQGRMEEDVTAVKEINAAEPEPTVFDDKEEKEDLERAKVLQKQYDQKQENINWNVVAEQMKNIIVYLKNMAGYKMQHFIGVTYDQVRPIFEREYNKVQTFLKSDRDEEPTKKRVAKETLLQESFKKLRAEVEVSGSEDTPTVDPTEMSKDDVQNMLQIVPVAEFKVEALQVKEDLDALWVLVKERFSTAVTTVDKEKALWVVLKRLYEPSADDVIWKLHRYTQYPIIWKLHSNCEVHQVSSTTRRHDMYMLAEKDYHLSNEVMTLMLSTKLQVEEDSEMARDLVMKIFIKPLNQRVEVWIHPPSD
nr:hypothetical protein [Tanacetum cinerariifolium]